MKRLIIKDDLISQVVSLHHEPAPGAAELRPLAAPTGQEPVLSQPIKTLHAIGDFLNFSWSKHFCSISEYGFDCELFAWRRTSKLWFIFLRTM